MLPFFQKLFILLLFYDLLRKYAAELEFNVNLQNVTPSPSLSWSFQHHPNNPTPDQLADYQIGAIQDVLHQNNTFCEPNVSTLTPLNSDDYRTDFLRDIDLPKTEWPHAIRENFNDIFWSVGNSDYDILDMHLIPEDGVQSVRFVVAR